MPARPLSLIPLFVAVALWLGLLGAAWPASEVALPAGVERVTSVEGITEYRLPNGLRVLLVPDASKPTTTVNMTYHVGSRQESYGETGMAHLLEHLMFKGSPKHPDPWAEFTKRGLQANGSTSFDRTNYFASFAANPDTLQWYLGWEADAMVNSYIARKDLDTEMTVVRNEMERGENDPQTVLVQNDLAALFHWHNYGKPTIGARSDVENVDIPRLQAFYRRYYQPDNATLIVSGAFDPGQTLQWIAAAFGPIPKPTRMLPTLYTLEPVQDGERSFTVRRVGGVPLLVAGYHVPAAADPAYAPMEAIALILGDEPAGRLYKRLVQKGLAASVYGFAWDLHDPGVAMFGAQLAPGQDLDAARRELLAAVESIGTEPVTQEELDRAKAKWINDWNRHFTDPQSVGVSLSSAVGQGDWRLFFLMRDRVRDLQLTDVQRAATRFLLASNRAIGSYVPTASPHRAPPLGRPDVEAMLKGYRGDPAAAQAESFVATPKNIEARTERFSLANGMKVALLPKGTRGQAVHARLTLHLGTEQSLFGSGEVPAFTAALLDRGTPKLSRQQIEDRFNRLQAQVSFGGEGGSVNVGIVTVRDKLPEVVTFVGELLREAAFPPEALEEVRAQTLASIEAQRKEPEALVENALDRHGDPYPKGDVRHARSFDALEADVRSVTAAQLKAFHDRFYGASHAEFGASGDMDAAALRRALETAFGGWSSKEPYARVPQPFVAVKPAEFVLNTPDKQNATMMVHQALPLNDLSPDYPAFTLANRLLGQGGNSRLWRRVREREGLSYDIRSGVDWNPIEDNSMWQASAIFAPQNRAKVETGFREEVARALKEGFTERELDEAKKGLLSARALARSQDRNLAAALASNLFLGRTFLVSQRVDEALARASLDEVNAALRKYLQPERFVLGFGGDFKQQP
ncbi:MAG: M16 family metallopeptidase [Betaproteobacteria bacterium]